MRIFRSILTENVCTVRFNTVPNLLQPTLDSGKKSNIGKISKQTVCHCSKITQFRKVQREKKMILILFLIYSPPRFCPFAIVVPFLDAIVSVLFNFTPSRSPKQNQSECEI